MMLRISRMRSRCSSTGMFRAKCKRRRALIGVIRIDNERLGQFTRGAGELRQDEHAALVLVGRDELLGHEVHAVVQAADEAEVGGAQVFVHGIRLVMLGQQHDRRMRRAS